MPSPLGPLSEILESTLAAPVKGAVLSVLPGTVAIGVALAFTIISTTCIVVTSYLYLVLYMPAHQAAVVLSLVTVSAATLCFVLAKRKLRASATTPKAPADHSTAYVALGNQAGQYIGQNPKQAAALALVAGIAVGAHPGLRKALLDLAQAQQ